ncbi:hypothetical protein [Alkalicella caledoniensis]|uniref:hypothetical protein n=1 Tax=Alkalicella caledoniensis TaxID=2731377 RepID=UPI001FE3DA6B|nr:hypothetical protein [Alkalicella caledoniensis]
MYTRKYAEALSYKKQGYRVIIVEIHLVFYKINQEDKTIITYVIIDGRREYRNRT